MCRKSRNSKSESSPKSEKTPEDKLSDNNRHTAVLEEDKRKSWWRKCWACKSRGKRIKRENTSSIGTQTTVRTDVDSLSSSLITENDINRMTYLCANSMNINAENSPPNQGEDGCILKQYYYNRKVGYELSTAIIGNNDENMSRNIQETGNFGKSSYENSNSLSGHEEERGSVVPKEDGGAERDFRSTRETLSGNKQTGNLCRSSSKNSNNIPGDNERGTAISRQCYALCGTVVPRQQDDVAERDLPLAQETSSENRQQTGIFCRSSSKCSIKLPGVKERGSVVSIQQDVGAEGEYIRETLPAKNRDSKRESKRSITSKKRQSIPSEKFTFAAEQRGHNGSFVNRRRKSRRSKVSTSRRKGSSVTRGRVMYKVDGRYVSNENQGLEVTKKSKNGNEDDENTPSEGGKYCMRKTSRSNESRQGSGQDIFVGSETASLAIRETSGKSKDIGSSYRRDRFEKRENDIRKALCDLETRWNNDIKGRGDFFTNKRVSVVKRRKPIKKTNAPEGKTKKVITYNIISQTTQNLCTTNYLNKDQMTSTEMRKDPLEKVRSTGKSEKQTQINCRASFSLPGSKVMSTKLGRNFSCGSTKSENSTSEDVLLKNLSAAFGEDFVQSYRYVSEALTKIQLAIELLEPKRVCEPNSIPSATMNVPLFSPGKQSPFQNVNKNKRTKSFQFLQSLNQKQLNQPQQHKIPLPLDIGIRFGKKLLRAAQDGRHDHVQKLLDAGADPNFSHGKKGNSLHRAAAETRPGIIPLLVAKGANVNALNGYGFTALHIAAYNDSSGRCVRELVDAGADVNFRSRSRMTPLQCAVMSRNNAAITALLNAGADRNAMTGRRNRSI